MGFNVTMVDPTYTGPTGTKTLLQRGAYKLEITHNEEKVVKDKPDNKYQEFLISVLEPAEFEGITFYEKVNTKNDSAKAIQIGQEMLSRIGNAVGLLEGEFEDLCHKPFVANVEIEKGTNGWPDKNKLGRVFWEDGAAPTELGPKGPPAAATAAVQPRAATVTPIAQGRPAVAAPARAWAQKRT